MSYYRAGGGYSRLAAPRGIVPTLATQGCEIVFIPQQETASGSISMANFDGLLELAQSLDFVVIGPGLSLDDETQDLVRRLVADVERPLLIDGDGITAVQADLNCVRQRSAPTVLTPHLGEMARLTGLNVDEIQADSVAALTDLTESLHASVVMKGAHSLVGQEDGRIFVNLTGNSGMATAGTGDVLTGAIAAMFGLGMPFEHAVRTGVFVHGLAGDLAAGSMGEDGVIASDVMGHLSDAVRILRRGVNEPGPARYMGPEVL
jgi:NAD(P)H-hydrate epimerase